MVPLVLLVVVFYFALIRPSKKGERPCGTARKPSGAGDRIVTTGGVVGVIVTVKEKTLSIRSADSKVRNHQVRNRRNYRAQRRIQ